MSLLALGSAPYHSYPCRRSKYESTTRNKSKLQVLSFIITPNFRRCPLTLKLTSYVLKLLNSCTLRPLTLTRLNFLVNKTMLFLFIFFTFKHLVFWASHKIIKT
ncbi:hypothetical protein Hanom_Chr07g00680141 [Helianthus anomalus]